ncbi:cytoplasmic NCK1 isoform X1, partial [Brachionus plicatilis]
MAATTSTNQSTTTNALAALNLSSTNVILIAKFDYKSKEPNELDLKKGERLVLLDNSKNWWFVRKTETDQTGYVPSNFVKKEKKSLLEKIIPKKLQTLTSNNSCENALKMQSSPVNNQLNSSVSSNSTVRSESSATTRALVKHKYNSAKPDELTLNVGTKVTVLEKFGDGWWKISADDSQMVGLYPSNYLQEDLNLSSNSLQNKSAMKNSASGEKQNECAINQVSPKLLDTSNTNLDSSYPKCESISSSEKDIEYLRVIYPFKASANIKATNSYSNELSVQVNEIVKLVEDDAEGLDYDKSWLKVFNSEGATGMIPSKCVEPLLEHQLQDFVFIRRPSSTGVLAYNNWYFGNITRFETVLLLNKYASNGDYLVRDSD